MDGLQLVKSVKNSIRKTGDTITGNLTATGGANFVGNLQGNATSATRLQTPRDITIGNATKPFDGSANISFTLAELGVNYPLDWESQADIINKPAIRRGVGTGSIMESNATSADGNYSHAEGRGTEAIGNYSHAEGTSTKAGGQGSHSEGISTKALFRASHAEGYATEAGADYAHVEGSHSIASGYTAHAQNYSTIAQGYCQTSIGKFNVAQGITNGFASTDNAFIIGNGSNNNTRSNAFRVTWGGITYSRGAYNTSGADYAEMFEWLDLNPNNEDRVGYFVTLEGEKIRKANSKDKYILGIVSSNPSIIGNNPIAWKDMYEVDEWGRPITEVIEETSGRFISETEEDEEIVKIETFKINKKWDNTLEYVSRDLRQEWGSVGLLGQLLVRDDGTCKIGHLCKVNDDGVATHSDNEGYYVMNRVNENIIKVMIK